MLNEKAPREVVKGQAVFKIGDFLILKKSVTTDPTQKSKNISPEKSKTRVKGSSRGRQSVYAAAILPKMDPEISLNRKEICKYFRILTKYLDW